ncbi:YggT family protein [Eremococcus coleocola]|uniref:YGGT family protein n=1 Tax=Eremococcus coleocola ACS-139-V-Col8 TaxID=908337 RepID=E4KP60_9LACT|nr:YggT family protein [Eremococcus coleocola]EFR31335.1 YGGT family protein [Eremococcus coleocola ACS-139-V-Col8]
MGLILFRLVDTIFNLYSFVLIAYALMSWFPQARSSKLGQLIRRLAEPYISVFDQFIPSLGGISFNVIIALFVLQFAQRGILSLLVVFL